MTPEVGKWYWVRFTEFGVHRVKCVVADDTVGAYTPKISSHGEATLLPHDYIIGEATPPRRWWQFWRTER